MLACFVCVIKHMAYKSKPSGTMTYSTKCECLFADGSKQEQEVEIQKELEQKKFSAKGISLSISYQKPRPNIYV